MNKPQDWIKWSAEARRASLKIWGYENLIDDRPEDAIIACNTGEDPEQYVLELGEDLDLIKATKYWLGEGYGI